jgi:multidrug efflux pump
MNPSRSFIERPVGTSLLMVAIMLVGMIAYRFLPLSALPEVDYPTIRVLTLYPGAGPEVMTSSITAPLERQFGQMPGLNQMTSTSSAGASVHHAAVRASSSARRRRAAGPGRHQRRRQPAAADLPAPPIYAKVQPGRCADPDARRHLQDRSADAACTTWSTRASPRSSSQLPGVGLVTLEAAQKPGVRIRANPTRSPPTASTSTIFAPPITTANVNTPKGNFDGPAARPIPSTANDQITELEPSTTSVVAYRNGRRCALRSRRPSRTSRRTTECAPG